ncbi:MAG: 4Fe-4S binding protein [bacterium]|jgi:NAD-dependent dihydropyrimidine dehydrogenase PreA subunit|nr:4Fe-4S binding protein [bacterium]
MMNYRRRPINFTRRIVQIISFVLIIYGGLLASSWGIQPQTVPWLSTIKPPADVNQEDQDSLLQEPAYYGQVFDTYTPVKSCRFARKTGMFRACFLQFLSESLTWRSSLRVVLPHLLIFLALAILLGRFWCGWLCPLGFISDMLGSTGSVCGAPRVPLSVLVRGYLKVFGYVLLATILIISFVISLPGIPWKWTKDLHISGCQMCPSRFIFPYITGYPMIQITYYSPRLITFFVIAIIFTIVFALSVIFRRIWCRFCPSGTLLSFFNQGGALTKEKQASKCTRCGACQIVCPLDSEEVYLEKASKVVNHPDCLHCYRCIDTCPENDCLEAKFLGFKLFKSKFKE